MNIDLRLQLIDAGFPDRKLNNSLVAGYKPSPTLDACYRTELYSDRKTIWNLKKKAVIARECRFHYAKPTKSRILAAMAFEERFQATRKADRERTDYDRQLNPRRTRVEATRKVGDWTESFA